MLTYELAAGSVIWISELLVVCLADLKLIRLKSLRTSDIKRKLLSDKGGKMIAVAADVYIVIDMISAARSASYPLMWQKYRVVAGLLVIAAGIIIVSNKPIYRLINLSTGIGGCLICIVSIIQYHIFPIYPFFYTSRVLPASRLQYVCGGGTDRHDSVDIAADNY
jgi:hypothetical protein